MREVWGSIPESVKSNIASPMARHRCDVPSELRCLDAQPPKWAPLLVTRFGVILNTAAITKIGFEISEKVSFFQLKNFFFRKFFFQ